MTRRPPRSTLFPYTPPFQPRRVVDKNPRLRQRPQSARQPRPLVARQVTASKAVRVHTPLRAEHAHEDRKSTRLNSSHANISYAVFCLKKKNTNTSVFTASPI